MVIFKYKNLKICKSELGCKLHVMHKPGFFKRWSVVGEYHDIETAIRELLKYDCGNKLMITIFDSDGQNEIYVSERCYPHPAVHLATLKIKTMR